MTKNVTGQFNREKPWFDSDSRLIKSYLSSALKKASMASDEAKLGHIKAKKSYPAQEANKKNEFIIQYSCGH